MSNPIRNSSDIRSAFIHFFENKSHKKIASSSLVPAEDPTLLFNNAGMNQFKSVFTGEEQRSYQKAVSVQKCVRAGGKHNDLENVGYTSRHHTFFEMMGNFSFGDYFKKEAIKYAWEFTTQVLKFPLDRLYVTVYQEDDDAYNIWKNDMGVDESRIYRFGEKDNFWSMGEVGPCGPCTELFYDQGESVPGEKLGDDSDRFLEFWNLVFMEFEQKKDGSRIKLPNPSIDTGMGLERATALYQGVTSNYESDLFLPILNTISNMAEGKNYLQASPTLLASYRVIADHIRCMTFLIADGVMPSNEGRGYVLRRIMRRAMRHGKKANLNQAFLYDLSRQVVDKMHTAYPELKKYQSSVEESILAEEKRFSTTIDRGLGLLEQEILQLKKNKSKTLNGTVAFHLYDTYGFPVDMTADILRENKFQLDEAGFEEAFELHREKARGSWKSKNQVDLSEVHAQWKQKNFDQEFVGYDTLQCQGEVLALVKDGKSVNVLVEGDEGLLLSSVTPFYAESGGQVGDEGVIESDSVSLVVHDTQKMLSHLHVNLVKVLKGKVKVKEKINLSVNAKDRKATAINHTATHLLHAALIKHLGEHVRQKGSLVSPDRLRFDFSHNKPLSDIDIRNIEKNINAQIWSGANVKKQSMSMNEAIAAGAMALFGEKYGEDVRVVSIGDYSTELCGGTHLDVSHEIGLFKIIKESSVSAGVRRIEALTADKALRYLNQQDEHLKTISKKIGANSDNLIEKIEVLLKKNKNVSTKKEITKDTFSEATQLTVQGMTLVQHVFEDLDMDTLRQVSDRYLEKIQSGIVMIAIQKDAKATLLCKVSKDLNKRVHAGKLIKIGAEIVGGSGGGRPDMAQAGGPNAGLVETALEKMTAAISE